MDDKQMWFGPKSLSSLEKRWIALSGLALVALTTLPYLVFRLNTPAHQEYAWASVFYYDDYFQYFAWARHIAGGDWLIRNYYTENPDASFALFNPFFLVLGWLTRFTGSIHFAYHALRASGVLAFAWISYCFVRLFLPTMRGRITAQLLLLGGGLEYPWFYLSAWLGLSVRYATPLADPYTFKVLYRYGHLTVCLCLLLIAIGTWVAELRSRPDRGGIPRFPGFVLWAAVAVLGLVNPYYLVLAGLLLGLDALSRRDLPACLTLGLAAGPAALNYALQPVTGHLGAISFDDPIHWGDLALFFAPLIVLAGAGGQACAPCGPDPIDSAGLSDKGRRMFPVYWLTLVAFMVLLPLKFEARMSFGAQVPLAILAASAWPRLRGWKWMCAALMLIDPAFTFTKEALDFSRKEVGRIDRGLIEVFAKLDSIAASSKDPRAVMTTIDAGNLLPAFTRLNVYAGHSFQTEDFYRKEKVVEAFFGPMTAGDAAAFMRANRLGYILVTPGVRAAHDKFSGKSFRSLYHGGGYAILSPREETTGIEKGR